MTSADRPAGCPLILVPSTLERDRLHRLARSAGGVIASVPMRLAGVGVAAAGVVAAHQIAVHRPPWVILVGLAGTYDPVRCPVGEAFLFTAARMVGLGAGGGGRHLSLAAMGLEPAYPGEEESPAGPMPDSATPARPRSVLSERLDWTIPEAFCRSGSAGLDDRWQADGDLLTVAQASLDRAEADRRRTDHRDAWAEEMESWPVAAACRLAGVPLAVVRGISNVAGERNVAAWAIDPALKACLVIVEALCRGANVG